MSRKTALKLPFAPDDYLVTWQLPTDSEERLAVHGALTVSADMPPKGTAHGEFPHIVEQMKNGGAGFPQYVDASQVTGRLSNGANVLLLNARVTYWLYSQAFIDADAAIITLANVTNADPVVFQRFEIQVGGLDAIAGTSPIKQTTFPQNGKGTWSAELNPDSCQEWKDSGGSLKLSFHGSFRTFDSHAFSMGFSPVVSAELAKPIRLRQLVDDWVTPIRRVVSIATGRAEELTYAVVYQPSTDDREPKGQLFGTGIAQEPYESTEEAVRKVEAPLRLKSDEVSLLQMVRAWQEMAAAHHPLIETYGSMLHARDQHPRSRFLLLLQAIEGTHGHETKASYAQRTKVHQATRADVLRTAEASLNEKQLRFLDKNMGKHPPGGLSAAVAWLVKKLPGDVRTRLDATRLVAATRSEPTNASSVADALRIIRNDLAHGKKGYDAYDLYEVVKVLELVVRARALQLLGCPEAVVERVLGAHK